MLLLLRLGGLPIFRATYTMGLFPCSPDCSGLKTTAETDLAGLGEEGAEAAGGRMRSVCCRGGCGADKGGCGGTICWTGLGRDCSVKNSQSWARVTGVSLASAEARAVDMATAVTLVTLPSGCSAPAALSTARLLDMPSEYVMIPNAFSRETSVDLGILSSEANCCNSTQTPASRPPPGAYRNKVKLTAPNSVVSQVAFHAEIAMV